MGMEEWDDYTSDYGSFPHSLLSTSKLNNIIVMIHPLRFEHQWNSLFQGLPSWPWPWSTPSLQASWPRPAPRRARRPTELCLEPKPEKPWENKGI